MSAEGRNRGEKKEPEENNKNVFYVPNYKDTNWQQERTRHDTDPVVRPWLTLHKLLAYYVEIPLRDHQSIVCKHHQRVAMFCCMTTLSLHIFRTSCCWRLMEGGGCSSVLIALAASAHCCICGCAWPSTIVRTRKCTISTEGWLMQSSWRKNQEIKKQK